MTVISGLVFLIFPYPGSAQRMWRCTLVWEGEGDPPTRGRPHPTYSEIFNLGIGWVGELVIREVRRHALD